MEKDSEGHLSHLRRLWEKTQPMHSRYNLATWGIMDSMLFQTVNSRTCLAKELVAERISRVCHTNLLQELRGLHGT
jgi:hypothetical protein